MLKLIRYCPYYTSIHTAETTIHVETAACFLISLSIVTDVEIIKIEHRRRVMLRRDKLIMPRRLISNAIVAPRNAEDLKM